MLGFYVQKVNIYDPGVNNFVVKWKNKLDIGDVNISILRERNKGYKEMCITFKQVFINTFNTIIMDTNYNK